MLSAQITVQTLLVVDSLAAAYARHDDDAGITNPHRGAGIGSVPSRVNLGN